jgi:hypothetical protein
MPPSSDITRGLTYLANDWIAAAIVWHVLIAVLLVALPLGRSVAPDPRPRPDIAAVVSFNTLRAGG